MDKNGFARDFRTIEAGSRYAERAPRPRVLLLGADYYGTLAAARCYGRHGIDVAMADANPAARGLYSRFVAERLTHPPVFEAERLLDWLTEYGARHPRTLLYPTNDHLAWLIADNAAELRQTFTLYAPPEKAVFALLDKKRLHDACIAVGIDVPKTMVATPGSEATIAATMPFPALLKPRTQAFLAGGVKGLIVESPSRLPAALARFRELVRFAPPLLTRHPEIVDPIVQPYIAAAETKIVSVAGFINRDGAIGTRSAVKVLQRPRKVGIGLCFEGRDGANEANANGTARAFERKIAALCGHVGYFGAFEAELIEDGDRHLFIDINPRFYSQMAFDVARDLPIPLLVWHAARGEHARAAEELSNARRWRARGGERYCHKTMLELVLTLQGWSRNMSKDDVRRWRAWVREQPDLVTDAVDDPEDRIPSLVDAAQWLQQFARHPRTFLRSYVLNR